MVRNAEGLLETLLAEMSVSAKGTFELFRK